MERPRFLIARLSSLGDVVCTLPAAGALKAGFPGCEVHWAVDPRFAAVVQSCAHVDRCVIVKPGFHPKTWPVFEGSYRAAFDLQGLSKSALCVARAKADAKYGYHWQREGAWLASRRVWPDPTSFHVVDQYVDVVRAAGGAADRAEFGMVPTSEAVASLKGKLEARGLAGQPYVVLNAGAGWATKRWPPGSFGELATRIARAGVAPLFVGGRAEADRNAFAEVASFSRDAVDFVGETNVAELIALIAGARANVAGDTGTSHIAAALGVPAVSMYSITRPQRCCPYGQIDRCLYDRAGLDRIGVGAVWEVLEPFLAGLR